MTNDLYLLLALSIVGIMDVSAEQCTGKSLVEWAEIAVRNCLTTNRGVGR